jgi:hypothetical protein
MSLSRRIVPHSDDLCYSDKHENIQSKEDEHTYYTIAVYKRDTNHIFYDHRNKNLQHESCVGQCGEATRQMKF